MSEQDFAVSRPEHRLRPQKAGRPLSRPCPEEPSTAWVRAAMWVNEAAKDRRATKGDTMSEARRAIWSYPGPRTKKLERADQRVALRRAFTQEEQKSGFQLPPEGRQFVQEARYLRRVRGTAGGATLRASLAVSQARLQIDAKCGNTFALQELARLARLKTNKETSGSESWEGGRGDSDADSAWGDSGRWGVSTVEGGVSGDADVQAAAEGAAAEGVASVAEAGSEHEEAGASSVDDGMYTFEWRVLSPDPWWMVHPGREFEETDDAPSPPQYGLDNAPSPPP
ncbi:hypothetical protein GGX14DRAFT_564030 [Mycena pura]|uniref:Uncharacterized protein n=1 Tax=Mycena pura TaxID=153505 RepID=A0AAD6VPN5_9AGAR|nr:hypothetical protein GGX14DRAFT_564030 [Mycena pura]